MICPTCKVERAHRSHRTGFKEWAWSLFGYYPYRCPACRTRTTLRHTSEASGAIRSEIVQTRRRIKWSRTRREILVYGSAVLIFLTILYFITRQRSGGEDG